MTRILFSAIVASAISISAHAATARTGAYLMPIGCTLEISSPYDNGGEIYLGYKCPGNASVGRFQDVLTFPGTENAVADEICKKFGGRRAQSIETNGWAAEHSVLVVTKSLEIFTHDDQQRDLVMLRKVNCTY